MKRLLASAAVAVLLAFASAAYAARDRPHEGKITDIDRTAQTITVQGEHGDSWTLGWDDTTKTKHNLTLQELQVGDMVHFDYVDKDGRMWITEIRRTHKAK